MRKTLLPALVWLFQSLFCWAAHPELSLFSNADGNLVGEDGQVTIYFKLSSWEPVQSDYRIELEAVNGTGEVIASENIPVRYTGGNLAVNTELEIAQYGPVTVTARLMEASGKDAIATQTLGLIRLVPPKQITDEQRQRSSIGINTHNGAQWSLFEKLGIHWARDYAAGGLGIGASPPKAKDGNNFRTVYDRAAAAGVIVLPCMQRGFHNADGTGFVADSKIEKSYEQLAKAFPEISVWEVENEYDTPLVKIGKDTVEVWGPMIAAAHKGLEASGTGAKLAMNGRAGIHTDFTRELLESEYGDDFSVVNYHYYTGTVPPEVSSANMNNGVDPGYEKFTYLDQLRIINQLAREHGKEAWLTEGGYDVKYGPAVGVENQAILLPRLYLTARWAGTDKIFWYFDRDVRGSTQKFGSCGLFDLSGHLRPSAASLAALSAQTATAKVLGRIDLGSPDIWCLVLEKDEGGYVLPAWTVSESVPLPAALNGATATYDMYGNAVSPAQLGPRMHYFHMDELRAGWSGMLATALVSPSVMSVQPGGSGTVAITQPAGSGITWQGLPEGVTADGLTLQVAQDVEAGPYPVQLVVSGDGWTKTLSMVLDVSAVLKVTREPFKPGSSTTLTFKAQGNQREDWRIGTTASGVAFTPARFSLSPGQTQSVSVAVPRAQTAIFQVNLTSASGFGQSFWMKPALHVVPEASFDDASPFPGEWPTRGEMSGASFSSTDLGKDLRTRFAWSPDGLAMAVRLPSKMLQSGNPQNFWEGSNIEFFIATDPGAGSGWNKTAHHFYFVPYKEGEQWDLASGEWKRSDAIKATIRDDDRVQKKAIETGDGMVLMAYIPAEALNMDRLRPGAEYAVAVAVRQVDAPLNFQTDYAWPKPKGDGILNGVEDWGTFVLGP